MRRRTQRVIIAAGDARRTETTNQLEHLIRLLHQDGFRVEVALVGDGERLASLRRLVPVFVADRFRTRGLGRVMSAVGFGQLASRYKGWRVRRWAALADAAVWIILDPLSCSLVRHGSRMPAVLVGAMLSPGAHLRTIAALDREVLDQADLWLAATEEQAAELAAAVEVPVVFVGDLYEPSRHLPSADSGQAPVVLSGRSGLWEEVSHAVEVIAGLHSRRPDIPIAWLADPGEDAWLARHDLAHLHLTVDAPVEVVLRDGPVPPVRPLLLVRTSYGATDPDLAVAAAFEGIPTIGFDLGDLPHVLGEPVPPFAVEALIDQIIMLLDDGRREQMGLELQSAIERWHDSRQRLQPLYDLLDRQDGSK